VDASNADKEVEKDVKKYKLPSVIEVAISLKIVDDRKTIEGYKFYSTDPIIQGEKKPQTSQAKSPYTYKEDPINQPKNNI
jgi:hypothetical protein